VVRLGPIWYSFLMGWESGVSAASIVESVIREWFDRDRFQPGSRLPAERVMAQELLVSRTTVRAGLTQLAAEGRVACSARRGWYVPQQLVGEPPDQLLSFSEMAESLGLVPGSQVHEFVERTASLDEADSLRIAPGASVYAFTRVRTMDELPVCLERSVIAGAVCPGLSARDLEGGSLYKVLMERYGVQILRSDFVIQAAFAEPQTARLLQMTPAAPVLIADDTVICQPDRPFMLATSIYRGDRYRFRVGVKR